MQDITVRNKEIRFKSDRIVVESENRAEKIRFTVTEASSIEGLSGMAFYMQYRNRLGEVGMDNLVKSTEGDNLYLDWLPSASFTKECGVVEVQIIGFTQSLVLTEDLTFQSGKLYFTSEGAYIPVYPATSSESPKVGDAITGSVYENEETLSDHRWSSQKAVLILPEDVFQGGTPVYTETQVRSLITEIATQLALAEDAADTASAAALAAQSYKTDAETARTQAQNRASAAEASKDKAEDWASKFNDANPSATQPVEDENYSAKKYAYDANVSEAEATEQRLITEGYAVGEQRGTPVGPLSPYFQNNAKFFYQSVQDTNLTKADKVDQATAGDLAGLDAHGNLTDSGIAASNVVKKTDVVNSTSSDSETLPLSAKMGKQLQTQIDSLGGRGRFLSLWNSIYGLPMTEPESSPYTYRSGDYYIVSKTVETELAIADDYSSSATYALGDLVKHNGTLYECTTAILTAEEWTAAHWTAAADHKPTGTSYTSGVRSTTLETEEVAPGDYYEFDGSVWTLFVNTVTYAQIKGDPHDSAALDAELDKKYEKPSTGIPGTDLAGAVQTSLGKADSAYQKPVAGIPSTDMSSGVQTSLGKADTAYQKPSGGIPTSDLADKANVAIIPYLEAKVNQRTFDPEFTVNYPSPIYGRGNIPTGLGIARWAEIPTIKGKSRAWNQLAKYVSGVRLSQDSDGVFTFINGTGQIWGKSFSEGFVDSLGILKNPSHKYLVAYTYVSGTIGSSKAFFGNGYNLTPSFELDNSSHARIITSNIWYPFISSSSVTDYTDLKFYLVIRDLTLIFGAGNEPATVADALAQLPALGQYNAYDAGSLVNTTIEGVEAIGFNRFDEDIEMGIIGTDGNNYNETSGTYWRSKNRIPCNGLESFYYKLPVGYTTANCIFTVFEYDANGTFLNFDSNIAGLFTTKASTKFMRFVLYFVTPRSTAPEEVCINISQPNTSVSPHNGDYVPYKSDTLSLSEPVTLKSAGAVAEVLDVQTGKKTRPIRAIDLGSLNYAILAAGYNHYFISTTTLDDINPLTMNALASGYVIASNSSYGDMPNRSIRIEANKCLTIKNEAYDASIPADIASFKASLSGVMMNYELATPFSDEQVCDPVPDSFLEVEEDGTISLIHEESPVIDDAFDVGYLIV